MPRDHGTSRSASSHQSSHFADFVNPLTSLFPSCILQRLGSGTCLRVLASWRRQVDIGRPLISACMAVLRIVVHSGGPRLMFFGPYRLFVQRTISMVLRPSLPHSGLIFYGIVLRSCCSSNLGSQQARAPCLARQAAISGRPWASNHARPAPWSANSVPTMLGWFRFARIHMCSNCSAAIPRVLVLCGANLLFGGPLGFARCLRLT